MEVQKIPLEEGVSPLKTIRTLLGMTQSQFAHVIGCEKETVSRWERGVYPATFTISQMKALDKTLKSAGFDLQDLPDSFAPYKSKSA